MFMLESILVPTDFSECALAALRYAVSLGKRFDATIDVLHVCDPPPYVSGFLFAREGYDEREFASLAHTQASLNLKDLLVRIEEESPGTRARTLLEAGDPRATILQVASDGQYGLVVMGTNGRTGMSHLILGSLAESIVRRAPCPVLTVRSGQPLLEAVAAPASRAIPNVTEDPPSLVGPERR